MHGSAIKDISIERRTGLVSPDDLWEKLSLAQKFTASSLIQFGYALICIRSTNSGKMAILGCDNITTVISEDGVIHTSNSFKIRH